MLKSIGKRARIALARIRLGALGRWQYLRGRSCSSFGLAHDTFHSLLDADSTSFSAHYYLGQIARARGMARLAFDHYLAAYRSSQSRFNRTRLPDDLKNHVALRHGLSRSRRVVVHEFGETPAPLLKDELVRGGSSEPTPTSEEYRSKPDSGHHPAEFTGSDEAQRFENRPPISAEEVEGVDLDLLISQLLADQ